MFGNFAKLDSPRRLVQFWQNLQTSLVLLIPNCTRQRMITYTNRKTHGYYIFWLTLYKGIFPDLILLVKGRVLPLNAMLIIQG